MAYHNHMENNSTPQSAPEHDEKTGSFAPRTAGAAYYEQEKNKKKSTPWIAIGVLALALLGGGFMGWQKYQENQILSSSMVTADLVQSVAALSEAEAEHGHAAAAEPDVDKRDRARLAIERLKHAQANLVALETNTTTEAVPQTVRLEPAQVSLLQYAQENTSKDTQASQLGLYKGILTRCYIGGHDVHWIDETGAILEHVDINILLGANDEKARAVINEATSVEQTVVVVIYEKGFEFFDLNGRRLESPKN